MTHGNCDCGCDHDHDYEDDYEPIVIETFTEDGERFEFTLDKFFEYKGTQYAILIPTDEDQPEGATEIDVLVMEIAETEEGYTFSAIENEELLDEIMEYINEELEDDFDDDDFEDEDFDEDSEKE
ncbi:MAG: DUF1292 domain-containing protein [Planctomycetia bacterium]|nr:DUF1292 domain-containing protein [Planctomycetia bacterium]